MTDKPENPPAFPNNNGYEELSGGMTLRDYFAGQALAGMCSDPQGGHYKNLPKYAYELADAMLSERRQGEQNEE